MGDETVKPIPMTYYLQQGKKMTPDEKKRFAEKVKIVKSKR